MSFSLPLAGTKAREEMGDVAHVAEVLAPRNANRLVPFAAALRMGRNLAGERGVKRVSIICMREDSDERWLISVGRRGGWRKLWNFGTGR